MLPTTNHPFILSKGIFVIILFFIISGCFPIDTSTTYNKSLTYGHSTSEPIYLGFYDNKGASFYFKLQHEVTSSHYLLRVYWKNPTKEAIFDGMQSSLKFLVNVNEIITLYPLNYPEVVAYDIENKIQIEEAIFALTSDQISSLAHAKSVKVELTGKYTTIVGHFTKLHTFRAFKNFLRNG